MTSAIRNPVKIASRANGKEKGPLPGLLNNQYEENSKILLSRNSP